MWQLQAIQAKHKRRPASLYAVVAASVILDIVGFLGFEKIGFGPIQAHVLSFFCSCIPYLIAINSWIAAPETGRSTSAQIALFLFLRLLVLCLRGGFVATASFSFHFPSLVIAVLAASLTLAMNFLADRIFLRSEIATQKDFLIAATGIIAYLLVLRFLFLGYSNLLPEEAYYWNYAQHLDIGYLDHPPMVAWLIWIGTHLFGDHEFGVRIGAYLCWFVTAGFSYAYARNLFDKPAAIGCTLLVAVAPFYFSTGFFMMPDAPLTAAWAATLYFLERALLGKKRGAWFGAGLSMGLGLLSKYTIVLLGPAAFLFMLMDPKSRRWLGQVEPYLAAALSILLFSPVIYWNATHQWMSFAFQGSRRVNAEFQFTLPSLIISAAVLLTPPGLIAAVVSLKSNFVAIRQRLGDGRPLFVFLFTFIPLIVFVVFSLSHENKPNWTGPLWLAVLPSIASMLVGPTAGTSFWDSRLKRAWPATIAIAMAVYALLFHYVALGFPGVGYVHNIRTLPVAWSEFGKAVGEIEAEIAKDSAKPVVLIGTDKYFLASEMAFYTRQAGFLRPNSVGQSAIGSDSLMYDVWYPPETVRGSTAILVSLKRNELQQSDLARYFSRLDDIQERVVLKNGAVAGTFYYRVGYNLGACQGEAPACAALMSR